MKKEKAGEKYAQKEGEKDGKKHGERHGEKLANTGKEIIFHPVGMNVDFHV